METEKFISNAHDIEKEIKDGLANLKQYYTTDLNKALKDIGDKKNYITQASSLGYEWLYDLVWHENEKDDANNTRFKNIILAMESERQNSSSKVQYASNIQEDFEKLLVTRSPYRLMIFESDSKDFTDKMINLLNEIVDRFNLSKIDDRFMYAVWNKQKNEFMFDLFIKS